MELRTVNEAKSENKSLNREDYIQRNIYIYVDDSTDQEEIELTEDDYDEAPCEADEESEDDEDDYSGDTNTEAVQPIWILCEGQILWAASHYGFRLSAKEYFRRRVQSILDFLAGEFPDKSYGELLLSLQGFFVKDNDGSKGNWLESLKNAGILYTNDRSMGYDIMPLGNLRAGKGKGKDSEDRSASLPENLEHLWLERELSKREHVSENPLLWKNCKGWILEGINEFCAEINELCNNFVSNNDEQGIGLKTMEFAYEEATLQRKKLKAWKEWWNRK